MQTAQQRSGLAVDLVSAVEAALSPRIMRTSGDHVYFNCLWPEHRDDTDAHMSYNRMKHTFNCHGRCNDRGGGIKELAGLLSVVVTASSSGARAPKVYYRYANGLRKVRQPITKDGRPDKLMWWQREDERGRWVDGRDKRDPGMYRQAEAFGGGPDEEIHVFNGEKAADRATLEGVKRATCFPDGEGRSKLNPAYLPLFGGRKVIWHVDNDAKGAEFAEEMQRTLPRVAKTIKVIAWGEHGVPVGGDAYDAFEKGLTPEELNAMVDRAPTVQTERAEQPMQRMQSISSLHALHTFSLADLWEEDEEDAQPSVVDRILTVGGAALLAGKPGEGKTWIVLLLALAVAAGLQFLGRFQCMRGPVLILDEENGGRRIRKRLRRLCRALAIDPAAIERIEIASMNGIDLGKPEWADAVAAKIRELRPVLVIVDSLVRVHKGDENNSRDVANLFGVVTQFRQEFGAAFLFTHHLRKKGLVNDLSERVRGSSDIEAYVDTLLGLEKVDNRLLLRQIKSRDEEAIKPLALAIQDLTEDSTSVVVLGEIDEETEKRETARALMREMLADGPKLRELLIEGGKEIGLSERTIADALKDLISTKEAERSKDGRKTTYALVQPVQPMQPMQPNADDAEVID
jgi:hypothetical protein